MSCTVETTINGNSIKIPISEGSTEDIISISSIQKITEQLKYIVPDTDIIESLYQSKDGLNILEADESFKNDLLTNEILADVKASAKDSFKKLFDNLIIYKSGVDNDIRSLKIYNKRILIIGNNIPEKSKFKILDAIINLSVDVELPENKIRRAKEFFNSKIIEGYTDYLFDQEASQNIYLKDFASSQVVKYEQGVTNRNIFYYNITTNERAVEGDIITKKDDSGNNQDYLYLGLSGESDNYHVLLKINNNDIDKSQVHIEKNISGLQVYKQKLPHNYNLPNENDLYNLTLNQIPFEKNSEISLNKGDVISFSSNGTTKNSIIVDVLLTDLDEEYLVYNDIDLFQYVSRGNIKPISKNSKINIIQNKFVESEYPSIINIENNNKSNDYLKLLKVNDVIEKIIPDDENIKEISKYKVIQISPNNTVTIVKFGTDIREKITLQDIKTIYLNGRKTIDNDLNILKSPLTFYTSFETSNERAKKYAALNGYLIGDGEKTEKDAFYTNDGLTKYVYDLGNYQKLNIPTEFIKSKLISGDIISKEDGEYKQFYKIISTTDNKGEIHINVAQLIDSNYKIFELTEDFFNDSIQVYSKNIERVKEFKKSQELKQLSDMSLDRKVVSMLEDNFGIPVEIIEDINKAFAYTDGERIFINIAKRKENDNTYVIKHAVHEFIHLMLGNMRTKNPEDYRILIESYKRVKNLEGDIIDIEETIVQNLSNILGEFEKIGVDSIDLDQEILQKINQGFASLFNIQIPDSLKSEWLAESAQSIINKYKRDFTFETTQDFQLSTIKKENQFLREIGKIKKEC